MDDLRQKINIFISYTTRDRRDSKLAHQLYEKLITQGIQAWIAPDNIPIGEQWEPQIISAVLNRCSHFLVILSHASASSWVLKEIELAQQRHAQDNSFKIITLQVGDPGVFEGKDFLDKFQRLEYQENVDSQVEILVKALKVRPFTSNQFETLIEEKTRNFVGRDYIFSSIDKFVAENKNGYFLIEADPGEGKSAFLAEFVRRSNCISFFNIRSQGINTPSQFLKYICEQLINYYELPFLTLPAGATENGAFLSQLLAKISIQLTESEKLIIAVDALDEVEQKYSGANILYLPPNLPTNVYFILTKRRDVDISLFVQSPRVGIKFEDFNEKGLEDIRLYISQAIQRLKLSEWLKNNSISEEKFIETLASKSESNFMYLRYVIPEIANGTYTNLDIKELPIGLMAFYEDHWKLMGMMNSPLPELKIQVVYILSVVVMPVSRQFIAEQLEDVTVSSIQEVLNEWAQFLHRHDFPDAAKYSVYHTSFRDFLHKKDIVQAAGVDLKEMHRRLIHSPFDMLFGKKK